MPEHTRAFTIRAHAKLNLALSVGAPVGDPGSPTHGLHPICSYMHAIELGDEVTIERLGVGVPSRFDIDWVGEDGSKRPVEWPIEQDLVYRAHAALEQVTQSPLPCVITVHKAIPAGGGLGGGSSDAAAVLMGLDRVFGLGLSLGRLRSIAATLGSDIGFFLDDRTPPRPAIVSGFGESIERVGTVHVGTPVTLILPRFGCSTGLVYRALDQMGPGGIEPARVHAVVAAKELADGQLFNDLGPAARSVAPALGGLIDLISSSVGRGVHVTGSGSTLFILGRVEPTTIWQVVPECRVMNTRLV